MRATGLGHRADRVFDRHRWIDPVLIIKIDHIDAEPLEGGVAGLPHVLQRQRALIILAEDRLKRGMKRIGAVIRDPGFVVVTP